MSASTSHRAGTADSWHGAVSPDGPFTPKAGRYHLYIGLFCPFAHRANLIRHLKGLTSIIDVSIVQPSSKGEKGWPGWPFPISDEEYPSATVDKLYGSKYLHEIYFRADKDYKGRYSVPVLWDSETETIVNNESLDLLRSLQTSFDPLLPEDQRGAVFYPPHLQSKIDEIVKWMQEDLNFGVYKAGNAPNQEAYDKLVVPVFAALNKLEDMLANTGGPYLLGDTLTETDLQAYPTLIRFDTVYHGLFKCNLGSIRHDYPLLNNWLKNLYWNVPGFKETTNFKHIKETYVKNFPNHNPQGIISMGPIPDVEKGFEADFSKVKAGNVGLP
ncbi:MAG: hypothetical protein M1818_006461 [Claussenomyces sp. TS43310]|nr:MAG: hypothetical protein M1818_006461 [Claussenomyces sp. TS43310]